LIPELLAIVVFASTRTTNLWPLAPPAKLVMVVGEVLAVAYRLPRETLGVVSPSENVRAASAHLPVSRPRAPDAMRYSVTSVEDAPPAPHTTRPLVFAPHTGLASPKAVTAQ
jgi:hypothetical protein